MSNTAAPDQSASLRSEAAYIEQLVAWLESTHDSSLDLPAELDALAASTCLLPQSATGCLRMGSGPHRARDVVARFRALRTLTDEIARWAALPPAGRSTLPDFLRESVPGLLSVPIETVLRWLAASPAPVSNALAAQLGLSAGLTWGAVWQQLTADPGQAA